MKRRNLIVGGFALTFALGALIAVHRGAQRNAEVTPASELVEAQSIGPQNIQKLEGHAFQALNDELALNAVRTSKGQPHFTGGETYRKVVSEYLRRRLNLSSNSEDNAARAVALVIREELKSAGLDAEAQRKVLNRMGKHFYNQSLIGAREGQIRAAKVKLLKLAIAHFEEGKSI